ncbi:hypothetical protein DH2020_017836 [Rehmannia glutinosa]|uniref:Uncharacterized protein n=1 Tax=Rehmannia glutinosa TaxID=99300 RepID=A0ABR0WKN2_REHGL
MSESNNQPQFVPVENEEDKKESMAENLIDRDDDGDGDGDRKELEEIHENEGEISDKVTTVNYSNYRDLGKQIAEDDDGFKTPTSAEHRIPAITECPPAPRKPRPNLKRKAASTSRCLEKLDEQSEEIQSRDKIVVI